MILSPRVFSGSNNSPVSSNVKYLGLILGQSLTWALHVSNKRLIFNSRRKDSPLSIINKTSKLYINFKIVLNRSLLKPIRTNSIQNIRSATKTSNIQEIQTFQSIGRLIYRKTYTYVSKPILHSYFRINFISEHGSIYTIIS